MVLVVEVRVFGFCFRAGTPTPGGRWGLELFFSNQPLSGFIPAKFVIRFGLEVKFLSMKDLSLSCEVSLFFSPHSIIAGWRGILCQLDLAYFEGLTPDWGLTEFGVPPLRCER